MMDNMDIARDISVKYNAPFLWVAGRISNHGYVKDVFDSNEIERHISKRYFKEDAIKIIHYDRTMQLGIVDVYYSISSANEYYEGQDSKDIMRIYEVKQPFVETKDRKIPHPITSMCKALNEIARSYSYRD